MTERTFMRPSFWGQAAQIAPGGYNQHGTPVVSQTQCAMYITTAMVVQWFGMGRL
jgi:hypothetical protein